MALDSSIREAWSSNLSVNQILNDRLEPEAMTLLTLGGGYAVAGQLAHMAELLVF